MALFAGALLAPVRVVEADQQESQDRARFEAASIKPNQTGTSTIRWTFENGRFTAVNVTLKALVSSAYGSPQQPLADFQMAGGPRWLDSARFDVTAVAPPDARRGGGVLSAAALGMLRTLLEERFQLRAHFEAREQAIYALVLNEEGRVGPRLRQRTADCAAVASGAVKGEPCGGQIFPGSVSARGTSMAQLVSGLARLMPNVGRLVVDRTGLTGTYDVDLTWTPDQVPAVDPSPGPMPIPPVDPNGPSLFTALREQLGLKLESARGSVQVLIIDNAAELTPD
ncbi:MAG TPA: TIGR03435 family protein [Vicinamibacterales bacterium]|nr:TIGR03435 family protein [Vicinamibacterales bacterium]